MSVFVFVALGFEHSVRSVGMHACRHHTHVTQIGRSRSTTSLR
jgi:formate/nitrite transporter FocA (FNT family)